MQGLFVLGIVFLLGRAMKAPPKAIAAILVLIWAGFTAGHAFFPNPDAPLRAISGGSLQLWLAVGVGLAVCLGGWWYWRKRR